MKPERRPGGQRAAGSRRVNFREPAQTFLIVCEGQKTEKLYFEAFKAPKDVRGINVVGTGLNTSSLVREAMRIRDQARSDYDQVWVVFDVEDYSAQAIHEAIALAQKNGVQVACSNQAFELWYLLHFHYYHTATSRQQYIETLSRLLGFPYQKNVCIYHRLIDRQGEALRNAIKLLQEYQFDDPARNDPSTGVHLLVEELNRFSPEARAAQGQ